MPRANRHYIPGYVWHITHRCHKKEFLLKFATDRRRWLRWLFEAKKRFGLSILNYMVTSNHIHLLVRDSSKESIISSSIQLIGGRTGQEYNLRKNRKGAYWEDRYHATAVETDRHLIQCMLYMDMNMVRAGAVSHPADWPLSGYNEIQAPRARYGLIDYEGLIGLLGFGSMEELAEAYRGWVGESVSRKEYFRDGKWTESVAVGGGAFVSAIKEKLGIKGIGRKMIEKDGSYELREHAEPYKTVLGPESEALRLQNAYFWNDIA